MLICKVYRHCAHFRLSVILLIYQHEDNHVAMKALGWKTLKIERKPKQQKRCILVVTYPRASITTMEICARFPFSFAAPVPQLLFLHMIDDSMDFYVLCHFEKPAVFL